VFAFQSESTNTSCKQAQSFGKNLWRIKAYSDFYRFSEPSIVKRSEMLAQNVEIFWKKYLASTYLNFCAEILKRSVAALCNMLVHVFFCTVFFKEWI